MKKLVRSARVPMPFADDIRHHEGAPFVNLMKNSRGMQSFRKYTVGIDVNRKMGR